MNRTLAYPYLSDIIKAATGLDLPLHIPMFGIMVALALLVATFVVEVEVRRLYRSGKIAGAVCRAKGPDGKRSEVQVLPEDLVIDLALQVAVAGAIGARLFHLLDHGQQFIAHPWGMIFGAGGYSIFGGLIVGGAVAAMFFKRHKLPMLVLYDAVAPAMMLGYAIGRIGCQLAGDGDWGIGAQLAGKPALLPLWWWAQTYEHNILGTVIASPGVYPTPVYETLMALLMFGVLWRVRRHPFRSGWLFSLYLVLCGAERFAIEHIRVNPVLHILGVDATQAQMISAIALVAGLAGLARFGRRTALSIASNPVARAQ